MKKITDFSKRNKTAIFMLVLLPLFLIFASDRLHQWDEACFLSEAAYNKDFGFTCFAFDHFRLHITILTLLVNIFGQGLIPLFVIDLIYALFVIIAIINLYYFSKILFGDGKKSRYIAIIALFLPITLYLGFKSITEVTSLLFASFALLFAAKGIRAKKSGISWFVISGIFVYLSSISRFDGPVLVYSFLGALLVMHLVRKPLQGIKLSRILLSATVVSAVFLFYFLAIFISTGFNGYERFISSKSIYSVLNMGYDEAKLPDTYEIYHSKENDEDPWLKTVFRNLVRKTSFNFSLFVIFMILSLFHLKNRNVVFSWVFYFFATLPVGIATEFSESRYTYLSIIPLSMIVFFGFQHLSGYKLFKSNRFLVPLVFVIVVLLNLPFINYMEANVSEKDYSVLIGKLRNSYDSFSIFVPIQWSDYSYLRYAYPELDIYSAQTIDDGTKTVLESERIINISQLSQITNDKIYICYEQFKRFTFLEKQLMHLSLFKRSITENRCELGWVWSNPNVKLQKVMEHGRYQAYLTTLS